ncbi:MAG: shikimate dehydrogenase [Nitrospinaceae bacterium]|mgnify:CR=1 FL=1|nr:shikimate dehydrogenase [Nitrospinaceae bacterium]MBT3822857.1 shikimate dehydrogenase [Nitrospinaceae bacterium]MBT4094587.1 shikimate dehydrogenase [Nitrospinaceae bacterium]MBT4430548.1 shikimate dehydrogenase [Nitrospinaceae bacterium]MBT5369020.1 shikimate dehydrogenase [Nitrospinaceae bacterium]
MALEKTLAIFGYPLGHTMSPTMHNAAAEALGLPYHFLAFEVRPENIEAAFRGSLAMGFGGLCITIPHKLAIHDLVDELSEDARIMGAVNVVTFGTDGKTMGHNTDGIGWLRSLEEETGETPKDKRCMIIGAGGAARAVAIKLAQSGAAHIEIRNRTVEKAGALAQFIEKKIPGARTSSGGLDDISSAAADYEIIVNTTSQGMKGDPAQEAATPLDTKSIPEGAICTDAVYNPVDTTFLKGAKSRGARTVSGVGWFVNQGAAAWELWTGTKMPTDLIRNKVLEALGAV